MSVIKMTSSVATAEEAANSVTWEAPSIAGPRANRRTKLTLSELEDVERIAWEEAYAKGHAAGLAAGEAEIRKRLEDVKNIENIVNALARPLTQIDQEVEQQLIALAFAIAKQVVRRELRMDPSQVIAVVRDTVSLLPLSQRNIRVHLHPQDAALLRERLAEPTAEQAWSIVEDPVLSRGGCRVSTDTAQIDARLETRIAAVLSHLMGDERNDTQRDGEL
jgi:flagellar assembly protein FliH